jgi:hypothetical protein
VRDNLKMRLPGLRYELMTKAACVVNVMLNASLHPCKFARNSVKPFLKPKKEVIWESDHASVDDIYAAYLWLLQ